MPLDHESKINPLSLTLLLSEHFTTATGKETKAATSSSSLRLEPLLSAPSRSADYCSLTMAPLLRSASDPAGPWLNRRMAVSVTEESCMQSLCLSELGWAGASRLHSDLPESLGPHYRHTTYQGPLYLLFSMFLLRIFPKKFLYTNLHLSQISDRLGEGRCSVGKEDATQARSP